MLAGRDLSRWTSLVEGMPLPRLSRRIKLLGVVLSKIDDKACVDRRNRSEDGSTARCNGSELIVETVLSRFNPDLLFLRDDQDA